MTIEMVSADMASFPAISELQMRRFRNPDGIWDKETFSGEQQLLDQFQFLDHSFRYSSSA
jgi:hypothetical protein